MNSYLVQKYRKYLFILLTIDLILIILHISRSAFGFPQKSAFSIAQERGYAEIFQYLKALAIVYILYKSGTQRSEKLYLTWSGMYAFIFLDDLLGLHEKGGKLAATLLPASLPFNVQGEDLGEVLFSLCVYGLLGTLILISSFRSEPVVRKSTQPLIFLLILLFFTGGVLDLVHSMITMPILWDILGILEDGGEMIVMSVTVYYIICMVGPNLLGTQPNGSVPKP